MCQPLLRMKENDRVVEWEKGLPSNDDLTPLTQTLITPILASAFVIKQQPTRTQADVNELSHATLAALQRRSTNVPSLDAYPSYGEHGTAGGGGGGPGGGGRSNNNNNNSKAGRDDAAAARSPGPAAERSAGPGALSSLSPSSGLARDGRPGGAFRPPYQSHREVPYVSTAMQLGVSPSTYMEAQQQQQQQAAAAAQQQQQSRSQSQGREPRRRSSSRDRDSPARAVSGSGGAGQSQAGGGGGGRDAPDARSDPPQQQPQSQQQPQQQQQQQQQQAPPAPLQPQPSATPSLVGGGTLPFSSYERRPDSERSYGGGGGADSSKAGSAGSAPKKARKMTDADSEDGDSGGGPENSSEEPNARTLKRPRLVWTPQLHKRFVDAVGHLGIKNAVPKTIMQLMNVEGLTRENVASHLQKYRLYLKRMQGLPTDGPAANDQLFASTPLPPNLGGSPIFMANHSREDGMPQAAYPPGVAIPHMGLSLTMGHYGGYEPHPYSSFARVPAQRSPSADHSHHSHHSHYSLSHGHSHHASQSQAQSSHHSHHRDHREFVVDSHSQPSSPPRRILTLFPTSSN